MASAAPFNYVTHGQEPLPHNETENQISSGSQFVLEIEKLVTQGEIYATQPRRQQMSRLPHTPCSLISDPLRTECIRVEMG